MVRKVVTAMRDESVADVLGKMKALGLHQIPVVDDGDRPVGLVSHAALLARTSVAPGMKVEHVMVSPPKLSPNDPITQAAETLMSAGLRAAPVVSGGRLVGIVSRTDLVHMLPEVPELASKTAREVMSLQPHAVTEGESIQRAQTILKGLAEQNLPVIDDHGSLVGVVGLKDIAKVLWRPKQKESRGEFVGERSPVEVRVESVMNRPPIAAAPDASLGEIVSLMERHDVSTVFVEENRRLVGVVTQADLVETILSQKEREGVYVQITGLSEEDPSIYDTIYSLIERKMRRITKLGVAPRVFTLHVVSYHHEGPRQKYSLRARLATSEGMYYGRGFDWDLFKALDILLDHLEANFRKEKSVQLTRRRGRRAPTGR